MISPCGTMAVRSIGLGLLLVFGVVSILGTNGGGNGGSPPTANCTKNGSHTLFVANFDADTVGAPPAPTAPLVYGPPGASLDIAGAANTAQVVNSAALGSQALRLTRGSVATTAEAVVGDIGSAPYTQGRYYANFDAHGAQIAQPLIAGAVVAVLADNGALAFNMKLYDGAYHLLHSNPPSRLSGSYDPATAHAVHVALDLDRKVFSLCIGGQAVVTEAAFLDSNFDALHALRYFLPATVTEAFPTEYVVDEIRITQE